MNGSSDLAGPPLDSTMWPTGSQPVYPLSLFSWLLLWSKVGVPPSEQDGMSFGVMAGGILVRTADGRRQRWPARWEFNWEESTTMMVCPTNDQRSEQADVGLLCR